MRQIYFFIAMGLLVTACAAAPAPRDVSAPQDKASDAGASELESEQLTHTEAQQRVVAERERIESLNAGEPVKQRKRRDLSNMAEPVQADDGQVQALRGCFGRCELAEDICYSSRSICSVAQDWPQDGEFRESCTWAQGQCREARLGCEDCKATGSP